MPTLIDTVNQRVAALNAASRFERAATPDASQHIVDALRRGEIYFYGTQPVQTGHADIDWSGSHVNHQEWPAQLNRFFWLEHAADVYTHTGDESIATIARDIINDWIEQHDYAADKPIGKGDNTLNISIRLGQGTRPGWWGCLPAFAGSPHFDDAFVEKMRQSTLGQLDYLATHLHQRGNWRISHLDCLLYVGSIVPGGEVHTPLAVRGLNDAFYRQMEEDGSHEEHNPSYHGWMCNLYTRLWRLQQAQPELGLKIETRRAARMWDYALYSSTPDGGSAGLHDGPNWRPREHPIDQPLPIEADRTQFLEEAGLAEDDEFQLRKVKVFPHAGQVFIRSSWTRDATHITFDATQWGGGHCHLSRNSVNLFTNERMLLIDPGTFTYETSDPYMVYCKSTPAHNTINLGGKSQTDANPPKLRVADFETATVVSSVYEGSYFGGDYTWGWWHGRGPGTFGRHQRTMLYLKTGLVLVFDLLALDGEGQPFAVHWQLPQGEVQVNEAAQSVITRSGDTDILVKLLSATSKATATIHEGETDPLRGWMAERPGTYHPAPLAAFEGTSTRLNEEFVTLLHPFVTDTPPDLNMKFDQREPGTPCRLSYELSDGLRQTVVVSPGLNRPIGEAGDIQTDADLAIVTYQRDEVRHAAVLGGLTLRVGETMLIDQPQRGDHEVRIF